MKPKFIYQVQKSHLPTAYPVYYYGLPDGKVYVIYSRLYDTLSRQETRIEYVVALLEEYSYKYDSGTVLYNNMSTLDAKLKLTGYHKMVELKAFRINPDVTEHRRFHEPLLNDAIKAYRHKLELEEQKRKEKEVKELRKQSEKPKMKRTKP